MKEYGLGANSGDEFYILYILGWVAYLVMWQSFNELAMLYLILTSQFR